ncbi:MAG: hypothetical protein JNL81_12835 [Hyphomonadaceae bacterium]|nr:hypothetical protein [Hyphomonadaceae bacterium]
MSVTEPLQSERPTPTELAEYIYDMAGQLAEMADVAGLAEAAVALKAAQRAIEVQF